MTPEVSAYDQDKECRSRENEICHTGGMKVDSRKEETENECKVQKCRAKRYGTDSSVY